jgi:hypothetical protein
MHLVSLLLLYLSSAWLAPAQSPASAQMRAPAPAEPFVAGVLRRDGNVIPFTSFNGKDWDAEWPAGLRDIELPISLDAVPSKWWGKAGMPGEMTIWNNGVRKGTLRLNAPALLPVVCTNRLAVKSNYGSTEMVPPLFVQPYPKDGLVVSGTPEVGPIEDVGAGSERTKAAILLLDPVDVAEQRAINQFTEWKHPVRRPERRKVPIEVEALYRAPMEEEGWAAYYVEAVKKYAPGPEDEGCGLVTSASGWIVTGPSKQWSRVVARITYCDRKGASFFLPLGLIRANGHTYWVSQSSGYDHEFYNVTRPTSKNIRYEVSYPVAACGR